MKRTFITFILTFTLIIPSIAEVNDPVDTYWGNRIGLVWQKIGNHHNNKDPHRTPPQIPNVYFDASTSTVYFENPCYECTLELVVPGTDTVAYSYIIPDGDDTVSLPTFLSGMYELHIHRGNYCFWGVIDLNE